MDFQYYSPDRLVPVFRERGIIPYFYRPCPGCVFTHVPAEDCIHHCDEFSTPSAQSDTFCMHCVDTINFDGEPFYLYEDKDLIKKLAELERIIEMAALP